MLEVCPIAALSDNYIWIVSQSDKNTVAVVDPGEAAPVREWLAAHGKTVGAYLITHHHGDHVGGLASLLAQHPAPVYGPATEAERIGHIDQPLRGGDRFPLACLDTEFQVIDVPGHTLGHIALNAEDVLLAGDALFRGGCGRVFEGSHAQMQVSLARLRALSPDTRVFGGHEYTQKNLAFAQAVEPDSRAIQQAIDRVDALRAEGKPSLPSTIEEECATNPFLRWDADTVRRAASHRAGRELSNAGEIFGVLRDWKDAS